MWKKSCSPLLCYFKTIQQGPDRTLQVTESRHCAQCQGEFIILFRNFLTLRLLPQHIFQGVMQLCIKFGVQGDFHCCSAIKLNSEESMAHMDLLYDCSMHWSGRTCQILNVIVIVSNLPEWLFLYDCHAVIPCATWRSKAGKWQQSSMNCFSSYTWLNCKTMTVLLSLKMLFPSCSPSNYLGQTESLGD